MFCFLALALFSAGLPVHSLDSLMESAVRPRGGTATAAVLRLRDGAMLWEHDSWRRMLPASTQKVLTASALRSLLGGSSTLSTRVLGTGTWADSTLTGDIVLEGNGDPSFARGPTITALEGLAQELSKKGLRHVRGGVTVRDPLLKPADNFWPGSWDWDNSLTDCDGGASTGISVDGNCPNDSSLPFPHRAAAAAFRTALSRAGILVDGPDRFDLGHRSPASDTVLAVRRSASLDRLLQEALAKSSNHDMETFGMVAGEENAVSSRQAGLSRVKTRLVKIGLDTQRTNLADECGLSRKNAISARDMASLLRRIALDPELDIFPLLPSPGSGTLAARFRHGLPDGTRLRAKTGTLDGVSALVGCLVPPRGDSLIFVLFFQGYSGSSTAIRYAQDQIVRVLAGGKPVRPAASDTASSLPHHSKPPRPRPAFLNP